MTIEGKNLTFSLVREDDAEFILELRNHETLSLFLHKTDVSSDKQRAWIREYMIREVEKKEFYFRIDQKTGEQFGFVRIYDINYDEGTFTWGSWILKPDKPRYAPIESALLLYEFAFGTLALEKCVFQVMHENKGVISFHKKFHPSYLGEDEVHVFYELTKEQYYKVRNSRFLKFLN